MSTVPIKPNEPIAKPGSAEPVRRAANPAGTVDTMVSMNPDAPKEVSSFKMWLAKLPCIGAFFAWLFGITIGDKEPEVNVNPTPKPHSAEVQAKNIKECLDPFVKANPEAAALDKAKEAFGRLDIRGKLEVLQKLQTNANCSQANLLLFVKLLPSTGPNSPLNQLHAHIEAQRPNGDVRKAADILEANAKDDVAMLGVKAYILEEQNKADAERQKKILANYAGPDFPAVEVCRSSIDCFVAIEGDKSKLGALQALMGVDNISDAHIVQFVAKLSARKPPEATAGAQPQPAGPALLRDLLFEKLKAQFGPGEAREQEAYAKALATAQRLKIQLNDPAPTKFEQLEDYFKARHSNLRIRQGVDNVILATLNEIA